MHTDLFESNPFETFDWGLPSLTQANSLSQAFGNPDYDASFWSLQDTPFTCAVVCQKMILHQFGVDVSEAQLVYDAATNGWLTQNGTSPLDAARLLEYYGVGTHTNFSGDLESLVSELAQGRKVIVSVDSGEIWRTDWFFEDWINPNGADHAIVLTGIDMSDPSNPKVYINDPGSPDGAGKAYPLHEFLDAWQDSGGFYVATNSAPSGLADHPNFGPNFNTDTGLYMDAAFWAELLKNLVPLITVAIVQSMLGADDGFLNVDSPWETLSDSARNNLFLTI